MRLGEIYEGVVVQWGNPLTSKSELSGGVGLTPGRAQSLERDDKGSQTRLGLLYFGDSSTIAKYRNFDFNFTFICTW